MTNPTASPADLPELPDDAQMVSGPKRAPVKDGERPLRVLDKAPGHLQKAALIVCVGALLPFMGHNGGLATTIGAKVVVLLGGWLMLQQVKHDWGPALENLFGKLASLQLGAKKKDEGDDKKRRRKPEPTNTSPHAHPPSVLQILALLLAYVVGCALVPMFDPTPKPPMVTWIAMAEVAMFAWAVFTYVHIVAYERWGAFNPLYPLLFLGILFAGISRVAAGVARVIEVKKAQLGIFSEGLDGIAAIAGGAIVAVGGGLAAYTIVEALRDAKREGDEKKRLANEARRAARKSGGGGSGRTPRASRPS